MDCNGKKQLENQYFVYKQKTVVTVAIYSIRSENISEHINKQPFFKQQHQLEWRWWKKDMTHAGYGYTDMI